MQITPRQAFVARHLESAMKEFKAASTSKLGELSNEGKNLNLESITAEAHRIADLAGYPKDEINTDDIRRLALNSTESKITVHSTVQSILAYFSESPDQVTEEFIIQELEDIGLSNFEKQQALRLIREDPVLAKHLGGQRQATIASPFSRSR